MAGCDCSFNLAGDSCYTYMLEREVKVVLLALIFTKGPSLFTLKEHMLHDRRQIKNLLQYTFLSARICLFVISIVKMSSDSGASLPVDL